MIFKFKEKTFKVDEEAELKRLRNIELVRQKQQAALDAAAAKYLEEKKLVNSYLNVNITLT